MSNITTSVQDAFTKARDMRIDFHLVQKGSSSLLTGIYDQEDSLVKGFYKKPAISNGKETKLAVVYGEVMITPYLIDAGVISSVNDPASIQKTYRFIAGEGQNSGVVTGANGSPMENIYIKNPNQTPQPVIRNDRPSTANVVLAASLGGVISSIPAIWSAIKGNAEADPKAQTKAVDPVTGKPLLNNTQVQANELAKQIPLGNLTDVDDSGRHDSYVLTYSADRGMWIAQPFNTGLKDSGAISGTVCGGSGGDGGNGGSGGDGGNGGTPGGLPPDPAPCTPLTSYVQLPCDPAPIKNKQGMVLLPTTQNNPNNEYTQSVNVLRTNGLEFHFMASAIGKEADWRISNDQIQLCNPMDPLNKPYENLVDPVKGQGQKPGQAGAAVKYKFPASFDILLCITANLNNVETLIYSTTITETGLSKTSYTFIGKTVMWTDTKIGEILAKYPGQIFTQANPNVKIYLQRTDECGSQSELYFEGFKKLIGANTYYDPTTPPPNTPPPTTVPKPIPPAVKADDGKYPDTKPTGGGMGPPSCPAPVPIDPTQPTQGTPGVPGTPGTPATPGECLDQVVPPPKPNPTIILRAPVARQYGKQTAPPVFDVAILPKATLTTGIPSELVTLTYTIISGLATFEMGTPVPPGVTAIPDGSKIVITGPRADVETASALIHIRPDTTAIGEIHYSAVVKNNDGSIGGTSGMLMPIQITVKDSYSAKTKVCVDPSSSSGSGAINVTFNNKTLPLTNGYVVYTGTPSGTASDFVTNINANVAIKNALDPMDPAWLPKFVAASTNGDIHVDAPSQGGADFNEVQLSTLTTGGFVFGDCPGTFLGGVTANINALLHKIPKWDKVSGVLGGIAGSVLGAVATNVIMNKMTHIEISIPTKEEVEIIFLYRGRVVDVPTEYNGLARTGAPINYDAWSKTFKKEYTNNPGWVLYDFITNQKYGLGSDLTFSSVQFEALQREIVEIAYYCDDRINDKPRFSTNTVITDGTKLQILQQLASVFYGGYTFVNGGLRITIDKPDTEIKLLVTQANAGSFEKTFSNARNFINKVRLTYIEPSTYYTESVVVAEVDNAIQTYGERAVDLVAFGCTDSDQATRYATWILNSELENTIVVSYTGGADHFRLIPGDIVEYYDSGERGVRRSGRIVSQTGANVVLDAPIQAVIGDFFSLTLGDGTVHQSTITAISGVNVTMAAAPLSNAIPWAVFIASPAIGRKLYKVIKVDETSIGRYATTLQLYKIDKY